MPDPVGAQIRVFSPATIFGQPIAWAGVGAANDASNQRLTGSLKGLSGGDSAVSEAMELKRSILRIDRTHHLSPYSAWGRVARQSTRSRDLTAGHHRAPPR